MHLLHPAPYPWIESTPVFLGPGPTGRFFSSCEGSISMLPFLGTTLFFCFFHPQTSRGGRLLGMHHDPLAFLPFLVVFPQIFFHFPTHSECPFEAPFHMGLKFQTISLPLLCCVFREIGRAMNSFSGCRLRRLSLYDLCIDSRQAPTECPASHFDFLSLICPAIIDFSGPRLFSHPPLPCFRHATFNPSCVQIFVSSRSESPSEEQ